MPRRFKRAADGFRPVWLTLVRIERGWTQLELASKVGISHWHLNKIERGKVALTIDMEKRLCHYLYSKHKGA